MGFIAVLLLGLLHMGLGAETPDLNPSQMTNITKETSKNKYHRLYLIYENDSNFNPMNDKYYTSGIRFAYYSKDFASTNGMGKFLRYIGILPYFLHEPELFSFGVFISQEIYTPKDGFSPIPLSTDHPYGGYLYAGFISQNRSENLLEQVELNVGLTGEGALGKQVQSFIHKLTNNPQLSGWDTQLKSEFVANLAYRISYRYVPKFLAKYEDYVDFMPQGSLSLGNAKTFLQACFVIRGGWHLTPNVLPFNINSGFVSVSSYANTFSIYGFVGVGGRLVGRNMFIEGNLFAPRNELELIRGVGEFIWGVALDYKYFHLAYNVIHRSKEFTTQDGFMTYGAISLGVSF